MPEKILRFSRKNEKKITSTIFSYIFIIKYNMHIVNYSIHIRKISTILKVPDLKFSDAPPSYCYEMFVMFLQNVTKKSCEEIRFRVKFLY